MQVREGELTSPRNKLKNILQVFKRHDQQVRAVPVAGGFCSSCLANLKSGVAVQVTGDLIPAQAYHAKVRKAAAGIAGLPEPSLTAGQQVALTT